MAPAAGLFRMWAGISGVTGLGFSPGLFRQWAGISWITGLAFPPELFPDTGQNFRGDFKFHGSHVHGSHIPLIEADYYIVLFVQIE